MLYINANAALRNKYYSGHYVKGGQRTLQGENWENKCGQRGSSAAAGGKWSQQQKTELDGHE